MYKILVTTDGEGTHSLVIEFPDRNVAIKAANLINEQRQSSLFQRALCLFAL